MKNLVLKPHLSEKSYALSSSNVYVFIVDTDLNKHEIASTVEKTYSVSVIKIRTVIQNGKAKRSYRKRRYENGTRSDFKKAYVTLKEGDHIPVFAAVEEEQKQVEKTQKVLDKAADKKSKKENKEITKGAKEK